VGPVDACDFTAVDQRVGHLFRELPRGSPESPRSVAAPAEYCQADHLAGPVSKMLSGSGLLRGSTQRGQISSTPSAGCRRSLTRQGFMEAHVSPRTCPNVTGMIKENLR
jgi:hypothetical protein